jgi:hypothetical protein
MGPRVLFHPDGLRVDDVPGRHHTSSVVREPVTVTLIQCPPADTFAPALHFGVVWSAHQ